MTTRALPILLLGALTGPASPLLAQATFEPPVEFSTPTRVRNVLAGDLDVDGHVDLLVADLVVGGGGVGLVHFYKGRGDLTFEEPVPAVGAGTAPLLLADVSGDGLLDLVTHDAAAADGPLVLRLGQGDGTFAAGFSLNAGFEPVTAVPGDFDGDDHQDFVILSSPPSSLLGGVFVAFGTGGGTIGTPVEITSGSFGIGGFVEAVDLDGDGLDDVLFGQVGSFDGSLTTRVFLSQGDGTFLPLPAAEPLFTAITSMLTGDVDGDGDRDVVLGAFGSLAGGETVYTYLNDGGGALSAPIASANASGGIDHGLDDVDGDGVLDVVALSHFGGAPNLLTTLSALKVLKGTGDGSFTPDLVVTLLDIPFGTALADLDEDGATDVIHGNANGGVSVVRNHAYGPRDSYHELGDALPGATGYPILLGDGGQVAGDPFCWCVANARPSAPAYLVLGLSSLDVPFKGGVLKPVPDLILGPLPVDAEGSLSVSGTTASAPGLELFLQFWLPDSDGQKGFAATNGLMMLNP